MVIIKLINIANKYKNRKKILKKIKDKIINIRVINIELIENVFEIKIIKKKGNREKAYKRK